jgi:IS1 family transposase
MANILPRERRLQVLAALVDGNSESAVGRMTDVNARTISRFALALGQGAERLHNRLVRDLTIGSIEVDEFWSYVQKKQARVTAADPPWVGEAYTFVGLDATSRLCVAYRVGKRDQETTDLFVADLRSRLLVMPWLMASDGFAPYISAIEASFGPSSAYAQVVKNYTHGGRRDDDHRYEPPRDPFITKRAIFGAPDLARASTAHIERNNGTMRHHIGRVRRLCYAFSKNVKNH